MVEFNNDFIDGVLFAVAAVVNCHDLPVVAADILRAADLEGADCSRMDFLEKRALYIVNQEPGINLQGL